MPYDPFPASPLYFDEASSNYFYDSAEARTEHSARRNGVIAAGPIKDDFPSPPDGGGSDGTNSPDGGGISYSFSTNGLWLQLTNVSGGVAYLNLHNATNYVYEIYGTLSLTNPLSNWNIEMEVFPTNSEIMPFTVSVLDRTNNLFFFARDWTGITSNGNTTPDWWFWMYFGTTALSDTNQDSQGQTLLDDYEDGFDPNILQFSINVTNNYVTTATPPAELNVTAGWPFYVAMVVDDTNYMADANWQPYAGENLNPNLGSMEGWHDVWVGLRGLPANAAQTWQWKRLKLDVSPPQLVITSPTSGIVDAPGIQIQGYSPEALASTSITYDLSNAAGLFTNQQVLIVDQHYSTNTWEFTTNTFQAFDVPLTNGLNTFTLYAADLAGNETTTNFSFTLDYSGKTNPPTVQFIWPKDGMTACGSNFVWSGWVSDPTATVTTQTVDTNGNTNMFNAAVGRDGIFYIENLPLGVGTNLFTLTAIDAAGNVATTNLAVIQGNVGLNIDSIVNNQTTVTGEIGSNNYTVWVMGVRATTNGDGTWEADNVPIPPNGSLVQVAAIPNTDNAGNGTGGGLGINPTSTSSQNAAAVAENAGAFISSANDSFTYHVSGAGTGSDGEDGSGAEDGSWLNEVFTMNWENGGEAEVTQVWTDWNNPDGSYAETITEDWPSSSWPQAELSGTLVDIVNGTTNYAGPVGPGSPAVEPHCDSAFSQTYPSGSETITEAYHQSTQEKFILATGGRPGSTKQTLWVVSASASTDMLIPSGSIWDDPPDDYPFAGIPYEQITIGDFGKLDANGISARVLPDNTEVDITPYVSGNDNYSFSFTPVKYPASFIVYVCQPDPNGVGGVNLAYVPGVGPGHCWWQLSCGAPTAAMNHFTSTNNSQWQNQQVGYGPNGPLWNPFTHALGTAPGILPWPNPDVPNITKTYNIGFTDLLNGLVYTDIRGFSWLTNSLSRGRVTH